MFPFCLLVLFKFLLYVVEILETCTNLYTFSFTLSSKNLFYRVKFKTVLIEF